MQKLADEFVKVKVNGRTFIGIEVLEEKKEKKKKKELERVGLGEVKPKDLEMYEKIVREAKENYHNSKEFREEVAKVDIEVLNALEKIEGPIESEKDANFKKYMKKSYLELIKLAVRGKMMGKAPNVSYTFNPISRKFITEDLEVNFSKEWEECEIRKKLKKDMEYKNIFQEMEKALLHPYQEKVLRQWYGVPKSMFLTSEEWEQAKYGSLVNCIYLEKTKNKPCTRPDDFLTALIREKLRGKIGAKRYLFSKVSKLSLACDEDMILKKIKGILTPGTIFDWGENQVEITNKRGEVYLVKGI